MPTADRVLPWRRSTQSVPDDVRELVELYRARHAKADTTLLTRAYAVAAEAHQGQVRRSGDPYIVHPLAVATILAELGLDASTLAAALLHDAVEDTVISLDDVTRDFGPEVAAMVDGVTKLDRIRFDSKEAQQAASMRKMLVAITKDGRVLLIKLADRLHNMRTIAALPRDKQERIAQETIDVYAPLAHRLGIGGIKWQLEDLSFATLYPKRYAEIEQMVSNRAPERDIYLSQVIEMVKGGLSASNVAGDVSGRPKHYWSIYEKMVVKRREFDEIHDLVGLRVVVGSVNDCYSALGTIHGMWKPVQGRFKDYIAMPKFNLYESLHTTVVGPQGKNIEVQIRTRDMHERAEYGVAAHSSYKGSGPVADMGWLRRIVDWQEETDDPREFMESLKLDLDQDEVFVFTPKGDVVTMALGATPIDFAYAIHTDIGHRCAGAKVNGRLVPLDSALKSGDRVEIFTKVGAGPSRDWLQVVVTPRARNKIRHWFSRSRREEAVETGREELVRYMRREGLPVQKLTNSAVLAKVAVDLNYADIEALHQAIGENHVSAQSVAQRLGRELRGGEHEEQLPTTVRRPARSRVQGTGGVHVEGLDDVMVRLAMCCTPVPGDEIVGFVTAGRGVSVHRSDCANAVTLTTSMGERQIEVDWDGARTGVFVASIEVEALDRARLLGDVSTAMADHHVNIVAASTHTGSDRVARLRFDFELADPSHLDAVLKSVKRVDSVFDAYRALPGSRR